jgi:hypothetical protein
MPGNLLHFERRDRVALTFGQLDHGKCPFPELMGCDDGSHSVR